MRMVRYVMAVAMLFGPTAAGQILTYSPTSLTFPPTPANGAASEQFVIITNHGSAPAIFSDYFLPLYFSLDSPAPTSVARVQQEYGRRAEPPAGGLLTVGIIYNPERGVDFEIPSAPLYPRLRVQSLDRSAERPQATFYSLPLIATTGNGPVLTFTPALLTFPATPAGGSSTAQVMVKNTGNAAAVISQFSSGSVFSEGANTCYPAIAAGATCNILFTFQSAGNRDSGPPPHRRRAQFARQSARRRSAGGPDVSAQRHGDRLGRASACASHYPVDDRAAEHHGSDQLR